MTVSITEFITARLEEDRSLAQAAIDDLYGEDDCFFDTSNEHIGSHYLHHQPSRVLREVEAKRSILELADEATGLDMSVDIDRGIGPRDEAAEPYVGDLIIRQMAQAYSDHPDYNPEWSIT